VRVTHPFHPWAGRQFAFAFRRTTWGEDRVFVVDDDGQLCGLPAGWTDAVARDPFVTVAAGRSALRVEDLLALAHLLHGLRDARSEEV
jgi:Family of unknown function (DUF5372)